MADKVVIEAEVKSNIGDVSKDADNAAGNIALMGVSLNSLKAAFTTVGKRAKLMFGSIRAGLISTGIGAFLVAIGSLISYFNNTKRGADKLSEAMAGIGAVVDVLTDRFSSFGEGLSLIFSGEFAKGSELLKKAISGITDEIKDESKAMMDLKKRRNELRDDEVKFITVKAETRKAIEKARLAAEDETLSAEERLKNLKDALKLEEQTTKQELKLAKERMQIKQEEMALSENSAEDERELAQLKADITDIETAQARLKRRVILEVNTLEKEIAADEKARQDKKIADLEAEIALRYKLATAIGASVGQISQLMQEGSAAAKAFALAEIATNTAVAYMQGLDIAQKAAAAAGPGAALAFPIFYATQVAAILGAVNQAKQILGSAPSVSGATPGAGGGAIAPQMVGGAFELGGGVAPEPLRAYVLTDEMSNSQNQLANIRRRATI